MKSIVQRYVGLNHNNCEIWLDTAWGSLPDALSHYPGETLREISVVLAPATKPTYWATSDNVRLRACCAKHSH